MGTLIPREKGNNIYYIYQETYRKKINKKDYGKTRGSGRSRVCTHATYLGTAEKILKCVKEKRSPVKVKTRDFGMIAAAYQTTFEIELPQILKKHINRNLQTHYVVNLRQRTVKFKTAETRL